MMIGTKIVAMALWYNRDDLRYNVQPFHQAYDLAHLCCQDDTTASRHGAHPDPISPRPTCRGGHWLETCEQSLNSLETRATGPFMDWDVEVPLFVGGQAKLDAHQRVSEAVPSPARFSLPCG